MYIEYFALLIPILGGLITFLLWKHKLVWWEMLLPIVVVLITILITSSIQRSSLTTDIEYLNETVQRVEYYEKWDEYIHQTCTRSCCCDSKGNNCSTTTYDCSYVDTHSEYWVAVTQHWRIRIKKSDFDYWRKRWGTTHFKDMGRDYHSIDGDMYYSDWTYTPDTSFVYTKSHKYKNKIQTSHSVFKYENITDGYADTLGLFKYPDKVGWGVDYLLGYDHNDFQPKLQLLNGYHGYRDQIVVWMLVFKNKGVDYAFRQQSYWKGGNKNEAVLCVSVDDSDVIQWSKVFTWSEATDFIYDIEHLMNPDDTLGVVLSNTETYHSMSKLIDSQWQRKEFSDFDYITIQLTTNQLIFIFVLSLLLTVGILIYGVRNEFEYDGGGKMINTTDYRHRNRRRKR